jgi:alanine racemase
VACVTVDGPAEAEACGVLKINLTAIASNWEWLNKYTEAECASVVKGNAYGCGIEPIASALSKSGCKIFFVTNLPEAKRVRAIAPNVSIYVLHGLYSGTAPGFAEVHAQPVINSLIEMAEWDAFVTSHQWSGGCALNVATGESGVGLSMEEAAAFAPKVHAPNRVPRPTRLKKSAWTPARQRDELIDKGCNNHRRIVGCVLSGARRVHPVIVGWSTRK